MRKQEFGLVGLAVMGQNLALNIERNGWSLAVYNRTTARTVEFVNGSAKGKNILPATTIEELVGSLERPRRIMLMVQAGAPVDETINLLLPHLEKRDLIIDGGNSFFQDTERRNKALAERGIFYIGTGVSGGEEGALHGPSIMPGGQKEAYDLVADVFNKIAAQTEDGPCCTYIGPGGAGHYVKMVHNGIEYGDMQLICEAYDVLANVLGYKAGKLHRVFTAWKKGPMNSYLIDITADIFARKDPETKKPLVDLILDKAGQKGTGKWTSQNALDVGVPTPTINAAVESRILSAFREERVAASKVLMGPSRAFRGGEKAFVAAVHDALYASKICSYAQGMALLRHASAEYGYDLNFVEIPRIWKGGCIIRARFLDDIKQAFQRRSDLPNLLVDEQFAARVQAAQSNWRRVVSTAVQMGIPALAMSASLAYYDAYRRERLPANLIQAQRDYFGAHTYERVDKPGTFHTEWMH
ncbi:MAG: NADP-dependent phosphogluconate dehydrogenase [Planctomycetota bacterium]